MQVFEIDHVGKKWGQGFCYTSQSGSDDKALELSYWCGRWQDLRLIFVCFRS